MRASDLSKPCARERFGNPGRMLCAELRRQMTGNRNDATARGKRLCLSVDFSRHVGAASIVLDLPDTYAGQYRNSGGNCLWNAVDAVREIPEAAAERVPDCLHQDRSRRGR